MKQLFILAISFMASVSACAIPWAPQTEETNADTGTEELIKFGDFNQWLVRNIKESRIIGGETRTIYAIAPNATWNNNNVYNGLGGSPWGSSNIMARVSGITKTNISVYKEERPGHGYCAKLMTHIVECKALGFINIKVLAAGSVFLGKMIEPITGTADPMKKLDCGMKLTKKPKYITFDYKIKLTGEPDRIRCTAGLGGGKKYPGKDYADCVLFLQKRWEDAEGNIYSKRVGTMVHRFTESTKDWVNNARFYIHYGDITKEAFFKPYMGLDAGGVTRYAKNSKGEMKPIQEVEWGGPNDSPTHIVLQFSSSHGGAYIGSPGNTFWLDNVKLGY